MSAAARRRGLSFENTVADVMRREGAYIVGSLRNTAGGGDLIGIRHGLARLNGSRPTLNLGRHVLVECKTTAGGPFERFGPVHRAAMLDAAEQAGAGAWLAYRPARTSIIRWIPAEDWPT